MRMLAIFLVSILTLMICDAIWIGFIAKDLYAEGIGSLLRQGPNGLAPIWPAAMLVYVLLTLGMLFFVLPKANHSYFLAFMWGMLFGAITYGVYDFTNYALMLNWPLNITLIDVAWGAFLCGLNSVVLTRVKRFFR